MKLSRVVPLHFHDRPSALYAVAYTHGHEEMVQRRIRRLTMVHLSVPAHTDGGPLKGAFKRFTLALSAPPPKPVASVVIPLSVIVRIVSVFGV